MLKEMLDAPIGIYLPKDIRIEIYHPIRIYDVVEMLIREDMDIPYQDMQPHIHICAIKYDRPRYISDVNQISMSMIFEYNACRCLSVMIGRISEFWQYFTADESQKDLFLALQELAFCLDSDWILKYPHKVETVLRWIDISDIDRHLHTLDGYGDVLLRVYGSYALVKHAIESPSQIIESTISGVENILLILDRCLRDNSLFCTVIENIRCGAFEGSYIYQMLREDPEIQQYL